MKTLTHQKILTPIILAGGTGTRLWPLSKVNSPKQFQKINGEQSLLHETLSHVDDFACSKAVIICQNLNRFVVAEQLSKKSGDAQLIIEPEGRNTLAAITVGCLAAMEKDKNNPIILVLPSDHLIQDESKFTKAISTAAELIESDQIITFGIEVARAETGYGYLKVGKPVGKANKPSENTGVLLLDNFIEKPPQDAAQEFMESSKYLWNSGMFMARANTIIELVKTYQPETFHHCKDAFDKSKTDLDFVRLEEKAYSRCEALSFDHGVMEKLCLDNCRSITPLVIPLNCGWEDLGAWDAVHRVHQKDSFGNALLSETVIRDSHNCLVKSDSKLVTLIGMRNTIVVDTKEALLVANIEQAQEVKELVIQLEKLGKHEALNSRVIYRPWGQYEILVSTNSHQIKKVTVNPGKKISLQKHFNRAEHWVVVSGVATVTCGDKVTKITKNESTYIPVEELHRLENDEQELLELIEVQTGDYFGEDDIERFDDEYGRV